MAIFVIPPFTTSFKLTFIFELMGKNKSTLEPNFINPNSVVCSAASFTVIATATTIVVAVIRQHFQIAEEVYSNLYYFT